MGYYYMERTLCVVLGGVMAAIWKKLAERPQGDMNMFKKVALGFLFVGLSFGVIGCNG